MMLSRTLAQRGRSVSVRLRQAGRSGRGSDRTSTFGRSINLLGGAAIGLGVFGACAGAKATSEQTEKVDFYQFQPPLGSGSFGVVKAARDLETQQDIAVKVVPAKVCGLIEQEIETLERVKKAGGHRNIVDFHGAIRRGAAPSWTLLHAILGPEEPGAREEDAAGCGETWLLFERVQGEELFDAINREGPMAEAAAARIAREASSALAFLHAKVRVAHADVKPENILISEEGEVKLCDFGCAVGIAAERAGALELGDVEDDGIGTAAYCAPELFAADRSGVTKAIDTWSLGCVLFILLAGVHPFDMDGLRDDRQVAEAICAEPLTFRDDPWAGVSDSMKDLIRDMMSKDPAKRPDMDQVHARLCTLMN